MIDSGGWENPFSCILKNGISDGLPYKDMLITVENCLFSNNKFIPACMMINVRSIVYDNYFISCDYFRIEAEQYAVFFAHGSQ